MTIFRFNNRMDYENELSRMIESRSSGSITDEEYDEIISEYITFCEVNGFVS